MRRFLQRAVRQRPPGAPTELRLVYGGQVCGSARPSSTRYGPGCTSGCSSPTRVGPEARRGLVTALWGDRPEGVTWTTKAFASELYDRDEFGRFARAWWPVLRPQDVLGWLGDEDRVRDAGRDWLSHPDAAALAESWSDVPGDVSVADVALLDELRALLGEPPRPNRRRARSRNMGIDFAGDDIRELSTVTDRYYSAPERPTRPDNYDGVRARAGGRGPGHLADAVADGEPARAAGELDDRRRRGAERLARTRTRRRARQDAMRGTQPPVPADHQLPELGRDLRVRGEWCAVRSRTPICRRRSAVPVRRRNIGWSTRPRSQRQCGRRDRAALRVEGTVGVIARRRRARSGRRLARPGRPAGAGRGRPASQGHRVRRVVVVEPDEIAAETQPASAVSTSS